MTLFLGSTDLANTLVRLRIDSEARAAFGLPPDLDAEARIRSIRKAFERDSL